MPALSMIKLPKPSNGAEFERMVACYAERAFGARTTMYGRPGQKQDGVDIIVETIPRICIQCKDYEKKRIRINDINKWVEEAENNPISFDALYIAIAQDYDVLLQTEVCGLSDVRRASGKFGVGVIFWGEIEQKIKEEEGLLRLFYPNYCIKEYELNRKYNDITNYISRQLIIDKNELRIRFLDLFVEYRIRDFLQVDPFMGFRFDMVIDCDSFLAEIDDVLNRSIVMSDSTTYKKIQNFAEAINGFSGYMAMICQTSINCEFVRYYQGFDSDVDRDKHQVKVEELRNYAIKCFKQIKK